MEQKEEMENGGHLVTWPGPKVHPSDTGLSSIVLDSGRALDDLSEIESETSYITMARYTVNA